jgi:hypothetical protein
MPLAVLGLLGTAVAIDSLALATASGVVLVDPPFGQEIDYINHWWWLASLVLAWPLWLFRKALATRPAVLARGRSGERTAILGVRRRAGSLGRLRLQFGLGALRLRRTHAHQCLCRGCCGRRGSRRASRTTRPSARTAE